jgi:hypothetical protein
MNIHFQNKLNLEYTIFGDRIWCKMNIHFQNILNLEYTIFCTETSEQNVT